MYALPVTSTWHWVSKGQTFIVDSLIHNFLRITIAVSGLSMLFPLQGMAGMPFPVINQPEEEGIKCVEPKDEMNRNHMNYILHQRDKTVYEGIRTETYSLAKCIDCHVQPDENGQIARIDSTEHFCNGCHQYASVQIDCFECHADRPQKYIKRKAKGLALKKQIQEVLLAHEKTIAQEKTGDTIK